ncbi:unnamed protein product [Gulo gulo]|uniref:Uncharacterized protein n=1 Tax=Gulo gulo TaxID=48420 RepID=A0A9X9M6N6_GULGU|nr:unnamed protein product [Gulo gulo]
MKATGLVRCGLSGEWRRQPKMVANLEIVTFLAPQPRELYHLLSKPRQLGTGFPAFPSALTVASSPFLWNNLCFPISNPAQHFSDHESSIIQKLQVGRDFILFVIICQHLMQCLVHSRPSISI